MTGPCYSNAVLHCRWRWQCLLPWAGGSALWPSSQPFPQIRALLLWLTLTSPVHTAGLTAVLSVFPVLVRGTLRCLTVSQEDQQHTLCLFRHDVQSNCKITVHKNSCVSKDFHMITQLACGAAQLLSSHAFHMVVIPARLLLWCSEAVLNLVTGVPLLWAPNCYT